MIFGVSLRNLPDGTVPIGSVCIEKCLNTITGETFLFVGHTASLTRSECLEMVEAAYLDSYKAE